MISQKKVNRLSCRRLFVMALPIILLMAAGGISGCSDSSGGEAGGGKGKKGGGYLLTGYHGVLNSDEGSATAVLLAGNTGLKFYAQAPWYVNMTLQVTDQNGHGISDLRASDFTVTENDILLDQAASNINIRKRGAFPPGFSYMLKTVLLIDNSPSVSSALLEQILEGAKALVDNMDTKNNQEVAIVTFDNDGAPMLVRDFTSNASQLRPYLTPGGASAIQRSFGAANLYGAFKYALELYDENPSPALPGFIQGFVVAITQGRDIAGLYGVNDAIAARDLGSKRVITVPAGSGIPDSILEDMERLGNAGYYPVPNTDKKDLTDQMVSIQEQMISFSDGFYWIQYKSEQSGAAGARRDHIVEVAVAGNANRGDNAIIAGDFSSIDFIGDTGVYFNASVADPSGITEVIFLLERGQVAGSVTEEISALTYSRTGKDPSAFTWTSMDPDIITVTPKSGRNNANAVIAVNKPGETVIRVTDTANGVSSDLNVKAVVREFSYEILQYAVESAPPWNVDATFQIRETDPFQKQWEWITDMKREEFALVEDKGTAFENQVDIESSEVHLRKRNRMPSAYSYALKTVLLMDNSPSSGDHEYLDLIKEAAKAFVDRAFVDDPKDIYYNKGPLLDASGGNQQQIAIWSFTDSGDSVLVQDFSRDRTALKEAIDAIPRGYGAIDLYGGMAGALRLWQNNQAPRTGGNQLQQGALVVMTDGWDSIGFTGKNTVLGEIKDKQVICVGVADDTVTRANINDLKAFGNAGYYSVPDPGVDLVNTLRHIQDQLVDFADSFYWLSYRSYTDVAGNCANTTDLDISINNNSNPIQEGISGDFETCRFFRGLPGTIYVNPTVTNPWGVDKVEIDFLRWGESFEIKSGIFSLEALTYKPGAEPDYRWTSLNPSIILIEADTNSYKNSRAALRLPANPRAGTGQIQVRDISNNTQKLILVEVEELDTLDELDRHLLAYYPFNGNALDATGNGYDGVPFGPTPVAGRKGSPNSAYSFNGTTDYIALNMFYGPDDGSRAWAGETISGITVAAWVNSSSNKNAQFIASFDRSEYWRLALKNDVGGNIGWSFADTSGLRRDLSPNLSYDYCDGNWHFIVATYDSNYAALYADGQEITRMAVNGPIGTGLTTWGFIGVGSEARFYNGSKMLPGTLFGDTLFQGVIDEVRIYSQALTSEQVSNLYQITK